MRTNNRYTKAISGFRTDEEGYEFYTTLREQFNSHAEMMRYLLASAPKMKKFDCAKGVCEDLINEILVSTSLPVSQRKYPLINQSILQRVVTARRGKNMNSEAVKEVMKAYENKINKYNNI